MRSPAKNSACQMSLVKQRRNIPPGIAVVTPSMTAAGNFGCEEGEKQVHAIIYLIGLVVVVLAVVNFVA